MVSYIIFCGVDYIARFTNELFRIRWK